MKYCSQIFDTLAYGLQHPLAPHKTKNPNFTPLQLGYQLKKKNYVYNGPFLYNSSLGCWTFNVTFAFPLKPRAAVYKGLSTCHACTLTVAAGAVSSMPLTYVRN